MFTNPKGDCISDIKCHPYKMHRILVAFKETALIVYSLNKDRMIQTVNFSQYDADKGRALGVEWMPQAAESFIVGYSSGLLCIYKAESKGHKPIKTIDMGIPSAFQMQLSIVQRG